MLEWWKHPREGVWCALALLVASTVLHWPIFLIRPLFGDNFYILAFVHSAPLDQLLTVDPRIYPEWRPLAFLSVWFEYRLFGLRQVSIYHFVNLSVWTLCLCMVYRVVNGLTQSRVAAIVAAVVLLIDRRAVMALIWIIERQTTMALVLGLAGLLVVLRAGERRLTPREIAAVLVALLGAALSKEYGLAFGLSLATYALWHRRRDLALPAFSAITVYGLLRLELANGAVGVYCEDMGFFTYVVERCMDPASGVTIAQGAYNVTAAFFGTPLRGLLGDFGAIRPDLVRLALAVPLTVLAIVGVVTGARGAGLIAMLIPFNALMNVVVYRERNLLIGAAAAAILAGVGYHSWRSVSTTPVWRGLRLAVVSYGVILTIVLAARTHRLTYRESAGTLVEDPCASDLDRFTEGRVFAPIVKRQFGLDNPDCVGSP